MSLTGAVSELDDGEWSREPRDLGLEAWVAGWHFGSGGGASVFARFLTRGEEESWREGFAEGRADRGLVRGWLT